MIKRLYVHNYRCLQNFELPISERPSSLLIGKNGTGKSTIGSVLELFQRIGRGTNRVGELVQASAFANFRYDAPMRFEMEVVIDSRIYAYTLALELPDGFRELRVLEEKLFVDGKRIYTREHAQVELGRATPQSARFMVDWHIIALPLIQAQPAGDPVSILRTWLGRMLILAPLPSLITGEVEVDKENPRPKRDVTDWGAWFVSLIRYAPAAYSEMDRYLKTVMPDFQDVKNPEPDRGGTIRVQFFNGATTLSLPFSDLSDGEKCFFICAMVIAARQAYGSIFCFWDEPDNYLSISEIGHFVLALRRSFQAGGQIVVTSHNQEVVRKFSDENTLVVGRRSHLEPTMIRLLRDMQASGDFMEALIGGDVEPWE
jgi:energy-coupling factor transporter ATP-binding protein EcfA2